MHHRARRQRPGPLTATREGRIRLRFRGETPQPRAGGVARGAGDRCLGAACARMGCSSAPRNGRPRRGLWWRVAWWRPHGTRPQPARSAKPRGNRPRLLPPRRIRARWPPRPLPTKKKSGDWGCHFADHGSYYWHVHGKLGACRPRPLPKGGYPRMNILSILPPRAAATRGGAAAAARPTAPRRLPGGPPKPRIVHGAPP